MIDAKRLLDQFLGSHVSGGANTPTGTPAHRSQQPAAGSSRFGGLGNLGGFGSGAAAGGLVGLLLGNKKSRKLGGKAVTYGGMAVLGALAYKAWQDWQAGKPPTPAAGRQEAEKEETLPPPPPTGSRFLPQAEDQPRQDQLSLALLRAMIAAAKSDGHIDAEEQQRIFRHVSEAELTADEKAFVMDELAKPLDIEAVVAPADSPETAAEIYAASLLAIDPDTPAERGYLAMLAGRLGLDPGLVQHLHAGVDKVTQ